jgi:hypothetical protein
MTLGQECVANPLGGDPLCTPCGWCTSSNDGEIFFEECDIIIHQQNFLLSWLMTKQSTVFFSCSQFALYRI